MPDPPDRLIAALAGRYAIERELGAGGMATVYLAEDLKHQRKVALKVLRPELAAVLGAERFLQEITTTAGLQHPHILPLYDSGRTGGQAAGRTDEFLYYVMPYIQGETLRDKLDRETLLGIDEAVRIATEVAGALDYAHRQGVIHRDIKPENILLQDGRALVADFGIALAVSAAAGGRMTETGMSLGTPHYMSPEQATAGKEITSRSDIYALGSVLYEMLTGDPPHTASSAQQIIMKIVTEEAAPVTKMRKSVPPHVAACLARALEKLPADRFTSAAEFSAALQNPAFTTVMTAGAHARPSARPSLVMSVLAAATVLATTLALWAWLARPGPGGQPVVEFTIEPPDSLSAIRGDFAVSPDGRRVVFVVDGEQPPTAATSNAAGWQRGSALYERSLDAHTAAMIPGTQGAEAPFFSPDGEWLGFFSFAEGALKRVPAAGGAAQVIARVPRGEGVAAVWGDDGWIYFSGLGPGLHRVRVEGGDIQRLTDPDSIAAEFYHFRPVPLPGGRTLLFTISTVEGPVIAALAVETGAYHRVVKGLMPTLTASEDLVYATAGGALLLQRFDARTMTVEGEPRRIADRVVVYFAMFAAYGLSPDGTLAYQTSGDAGGNLLLVRRDGTERLLFAGSDVNHPRFSPSGDRIAFVRSEAGVLGNVWVHSVSQGTTERVGFEEGSSADPAWTPDGRRLAYAVFGAGRPFATLHIRSADGSGSSQEVAVGDGDAYQPDFAPGGRDLIFERGHDVWRVAVDGSSGPTPLLRERWNEWHAQISPDGRWMAYTSDETGVEQVYVRSYPDMESRTAISVTGGREPVWSASGQEIFYRNAWMMAASVRVEEDRLVVTERTPLFRAGKYWIVANRNYDVHPNGREFVMVSGQASRAVVRVNALGTGR